MLVTFDFNVLTFKSNGLCTGASDFTVKAACISYSIAYKKQKKRTFPVSLDFLLCLLSDHKKAKRTYMSTEHISVTQKKSQNTEDTSYKHRHQQTLTKKKHNVT